MISTMQKKLKKQKKKMIKIKQEEEVEILDNGGKRTTSRCKCQSGVLKKRAGSVWREQAQYWDDM